MESSVVDSVSKTFNMIKFELSGLFTVMNKVWFIEHSKISHFIHKKNIITSFLILATQGFYIHDSRAAYRKGIYEGQTNKQTNKLLLK